MNSTPLQWFKSSHSGSDGGDCVEVAYNWHKSTYSNDEGGACVEVAAHPAAVHIRDSKNPDTAPHITIAPHAWTTFLTHH
ncbi:DUF397 domain-containing protein [Streptomyces sp. NPDC052077]|uniref:DUF397 domain-containing protein n=1 Tax=Streptomyces sp. NPDC052077 TaxID=3154757 RepID=UPI00344211A4